MIPNVLRDYPELATPHVRNKGLFVVKLLAKQLIDKRQLGKAARWELAQSVLKPLFAEVSEAYLYPDGTSPDSSPKNHSTTPKFLIPEKKRYRVDCDSDLFNESYREFWVDWDWARGSLVWRVSKGSEHLASALSHCYDPIAMDNPSAVLNPNPIRLIRRRIGTEPDSIWCGLPSGTEYLFIFSGWPTVRKAFETALQNCQFTGEFKACYGAA